MMKYLHKIQNVKRLIRSKITSFKINSITTLKLVFVIAILNLSLHPLLSQNTEPFTKYYSAGDFENALKQSNKLMKYYPENPEIVVMHGRVLVDLGRYKEGEVFLNKAILLDSNKSWISAWAWAYLGHSNYMSGNYIDSEIALNKCLALNATQNVNKYANQRMFIFGYDKYFSDWKVVETEHLRFHFQIPTEIANLSDFASQREEVFLKISTELGATIPKKIDFFVWNNAEEPKSKFNINLGFAKPEFASVYIQKNQTKGHEMTHVITHYTGKVKKKTNLINEGTAVYFNQSNDNKLALAKSYLIKNNLPQVSIRDVWDHWEKYNQGLSYPLAGAFITEVIQKFGIDGLKKILSDQTYKNAKKTLGDDLDILISDFEKKINTGLENNMALENDQINMTDSMNRMHLMHMPRLLFILNGTEVTLNELSKINKDDIDTVEVITKEEDIKKITDKDYNQVHLIRTKSKIIITPDTINTIKTPLDTTKNDFITSLIKEEFHKGQITTLQPLLIIDGLETDIATMQAMKLSKEQVEKVSFLEKEFSTSIYGPGANKGVMIINTKHRITSK